MVRKISAQLARDNFGELISSVHFTKEPVVVEKQGKPFAAFISADQLDEYLSLKAARAWEVIDRIRASNADADPDEAFALITGEVEHVRKARTMARQRAGETGH